MTSVTKAVIFNPHYGSLGQGQLFSTVLSMLKVEFLSLFSGDRKVQRRSESIHSGLLWQR